MFKSRTFVIAAIAVGIVAINLIVFAAGPFVAAQAPSPAAGDLQVDGASQLTAPANGETLSQKPSTGWGIFYLHPLYAPEETEGR